MSESTDNKEDIENEGSTGTKAEKATEEVIESTTDAAPKKKKGGLIKLLVVVVIIVAVILVAYFTGLVDYLDLNHENITAVKDFIDGFGFLGYLIYILLYIVAAVFFLPALIFAILAGAVFGPVLGGILALVGATIGATAAFIVARYVARQSIVNRFGSSPLFRKIDDGLSKNGVSFLILTRLVPIFPYNVQNYIYGLTPIKLGTYSLVSLITMAPGAFIYAFIAGEIVQQLERGEAVDFTRLLIILAAAGVVLYLISLIPKYIAKKKGIKIKDD